jgi:hypothetical protein
MSKLSTITRAPHASPVPPLPAVTVPPSNRWALPLIAGTAIAVVGLLAALIIVLRNDSRRQAAERPAMERAPVERPVPERPAPESEKPVPPKEKSPPQAAEITVRPTVPPPGQKPTARPPESVLALVGGLTTANLYQSYLNVGLLADSVAKGVYKPEHGKELLETVTKVIDTVERQLAQLPESDLTAGEKVRLAKVRSIVSLLRSEIKELQAYWASGDEEFVRKFQKIHKDVWSELEKLLAEG